MHQRQLLNTILIMARPMILLHTTSPERAFAIVRDGFRVSPDIFPDDHCVNFHEGKLTSQPENRGCMMEFEWVGDPPQDFTGRPVAEMEPNILYRQGGIWRLALRPGTNTGLKFLKIIFDEDNTDWASKHREENSEFERAIGRTIPIAYHVQAARESNREPGLIKTVINRVFG